MTKNARVLSGIRMETNGTKRGFTSDLDLRSRHARSRMQKRSISPIAVELIQRHGKSVRSHGANKYFLDKQARKQIEKKIGKQAYLRLKDLLDIYVVESDDGEVITVAHRRRKIREGGVRRPVRRAAGRKAEGAHTPLRRSSRPGHFPADAS